MGSPPTWRGRIAGPSLRAISSSADIHAHMNWQKTRAGSYTHLMWKKRARVNPPLASINAPSAHAPVRAPKGPASNRREQPILNLTLMANLLSPHFHLARTPTTLTSMTMTVTTRLATTQRLGTRPIAMTPPPRQAAAVVGVPLNHSLSGVVRFRDLSELSSEATSPLKFESILWDNSLLVYYNID